MKKNIYFIYDNCIKPPFSIESIVGKRSFGEIIYKRVKLGEKIREHVLNSGIENFIEIKEPHERQEVIKQLKEKSGNSVFIHFFSNAVIIDSEKFSTLLDKIVYFQSTGINQENDPFMLGFTNIIEYERYINFFEKVNFITKADFDDNTLIFSPKDFAIDVSDLATFLNFFSGGFETRYFNQLVGDKYTLKKKSTDKQKMEKEYTYYHLLPDSMKKWYVMPYDFKVESNYASYTMERLNVPDMALQWIHNSMSLSDFNIFLEKIFSFISTRPSKKINEEKYKLRFSELYYQKILDRLEKLKELNEFQQLDGLVQHGTIYNFEKIIEDYKGLYQLLIREVTIFNEVIGHGDLCFSNILYDKNSHMMKFIDTKGALKEEDIWTDPYYDLAKLSHSIMGNYDFINNELFSISMNNGLLLQLNLKTESLNQYQLLFIKKLEEAGFDIRLVRLCEVSLFLSMLPLHIDNPRKVLGYIINAIQIKEELELNV